MKNIHDFDQWINEQEKKPASATQEPSWAKPLRMVNGLVRGFSSKFPDMIAWKLYGQGKTIWKLIFRLKDGKMQVITESLDPNAIATVTKFHNDLMKELKTITLSSEPFGKLKDKSVLPGRKAEGNVEYGLIEVDPKNAAKAFAGFKKVVAKYPKLLKKM